MIRFGSVHALINVMIQLRVHAIAATLDLPIELIGVSLMVGSAAYEETRWQVSRGELWSYAYVLAMNFSEYSSLLHDLAEAVQIGRHLFALVARGRRRNHTPE